MRNEPHEASLPHTSLARPVSNGAMQNAYVDVFREYHDIYPNIIYH